MKILLPILFLYCGSSLALEFELNSTENQTKVIELYTSEGCSSCPPADKWLSTLKQSKQLWNEIIPIAFHVDYWDYIGWKDKLALPNNSSRQRIHRALDNISSVYTPGILKAGKEWRAWRFSKAAGIIDSPITVGKLTVKVKGDMLTANFLPKFNAVDYKLNVALLGMNILNKIKAGENDGKILKHDFVLLKHQTFTSELPNWETKLEPEFFSAQYNDLAFVVWIETEDNPAPVQAVGKFL
ncbi:MAG: DUF1223 domain-containing protein [Proteobacteria bacterium]|nr:DUF1223 domain-containing protein [Pseudomonadota bacterium]